MNHPRVTVSGKSSGNKKAAQRQRRVEATRIVLIVLVTLLWFAPILWIMLTAFKSRPDVYSMSVLFTPTLENFVVAFEVPYLLGDRLLNSILVTLGTLVIAIPASTAAAYALSRFRFPGGVIWPLGLLSTQFLPPVIIIIPLFIVFIHLQILDTRTALIIANLSFVIPYATWMIKGFIDALPLDMEEAGQIDGASRMRVIWDIVVPVTIPGIATATIFSFVVSWNEFFYALVLTRDAAVTMPVALMGVRTDQGIAWEIMAAMGLVIVAPMLLIARYIQKFFVKGLTSGAVR